VFAGLRERDVGAFTGLTRTEIETRWPGLLGGPGRLDPPGAETRTALVARALATLHRVAELHPGRAVMAISHGALIRCLEAHLGVTLDGPPAHLAGRWLTVEDASVLPGPAAALVA
jgi:broad specificity phosphatase PhoE